MSFGIYIVGYIILIIGLAIGLTYQHKLEYVVLLEVLNVCN